MKRKVLSVLVFLALLVATWTKKNRARPLRLQRKEAYLNAAAVVFMHASNIGFWNLLFWALTYP